MLAVLRVGGMRREFSSGHITPARDNDIERSYGHARNMVCDWGLREPGSADYGKRMKPFPWPRDCQHRDYSEATAIQIDKEVKAYRQRRLCHSIPSCRRSGNARAHCAGCSSAKYRPPLSEVLMEGKPLPETAADASHDAAAGASGGSEVGTGRKCGRHRISAWRESS